LSAWLPALAMELSRGYVLVLCGQPRYAVLIFVAISAISESFSYFFRCQMSRVENNPSPLFRGTT
jgi:hypothetical protein